MRLISKSNHDQPSRFSDPRIIEFRPRARPRGLSPKPDHGPIIDPVRQLDIAADRLRMQQNLAAAIVLVLLMSAGLWVVHELTTSSRILTCLEAGHRNCLPIDQAWRPN
jgi:hypothetical protein